MKFVDGQNQLTRFEELLEGGAGGLAVGCAGTAGCSFYVSRQTFGRAGRAGTDRSGDLFRGTGEETSPSGTSWPTPWTADARSLARQD